MFTLQTEKRELNLKAKQLRRNGIIPGVLYGKHLEESVHIQMTQRQAEQFLKSNAIGSRLELVIDGEKHAAMLKDVTYTIPKNRIEHLSFQALKATDKVNSIIHIHLLGQEKVTDGLVLQMLNEIPYRALPANMVDRIEVGVEGLVVGDNIKLQDLPISQNEDIEIQIPLDSVVVTVTARKEQIIETDETGEAGAEADATETAEGSEG